MIINLKKLNRYCFAVGNLYWVSKINGCIENIEVHILIGLWHIRIQTAYLQNVAWKNILIYASICFLSGAYYGNSHAKKSLFWVVFFLKL